MTVPDAFRLSLDALLRARPISQTELADRAGRSEALIRRYLNGSRVPRLDTVEAIRDALDVTPAELFDPDAALAKLGLTRRVDDTEEQRRRTTVALAATDPVVSESPTKSSEGGSALAHPDSELLAALIAFWDQMSPEARLELVGHGHRLRSTSAASVAGFKVG